MIPEPEKHQAKDLDMVPLQETDSDAMDDAAPKSATAFFALPTPKRKAPEPEPEPTPPPQPGAPPAGMPPMGPGSMPPMGPGSMGGMPMGGIGISGPVAGAPSGMPQQGYGMGGGTLAPPPDPDQDRARSYRVFALVAGLMLMVCTAVLIMGGLVVGAVVLGDQDDGSADAKPPLTAPSPSPRTAPVVDTAVPKPQPDPKPRPRPSGNPRPRPAPAPAPAAPAPAPAPVGPATATIKIGASDPFTGIEIACPISGFRERASFAGGVATVANVPQEDCAVNFKGGPPARNTIRGGQTKTCEFSTGSAVCN